MDHPRFKDFFALVEATLSLLALSFVTVPLMAQDNRPRTMSMPVPGGEINVTFPETPMKLSRQDLLDWVRAAAKAVSHYYGRFPARRLTLKIEAHEGSGVRHGVTYPKDGGFIRVTVGADAERL